MITRAQAITWTCEDCEAELEPGTPCPTHPGAAWALRPEISPRFSGRHVVPGVAGRQPPDPHPLDGIVRLEAHSPPERTSATEVPATMAAPTQGHRVTVEATKAPGGLVVCLGPRGLLEV